MLAYLVQDKLRSWFDEHLTTYFDFFRFSPQWQSHVLFPYLARFNAADPNRDSEGTNFINLRIGQDAVAVRGQGTDNFRYRTNPDVTIQFFDNDEDWKKPIRMAALQVIRLPPPGSLMTITHNSSLDFPGGSFNVRQKFNLTRTKFVFTLLKESGQTQNVAGELIDVSVPHRLDSKIAHFFQHLRQNVVPYRLTMGPDCTLGFLAYSLDYLTFDLEDVLFAQKYFPWMDIKYGKRLSRLIYMYFIDVFIKLENATDKLQLLRDARNWVFKPMAEGTQTTARLSRFVDNFLAKYDPRLTRVKLNILVFMNHLKHLSEKVAADKTIEPAVLSGRIKGMGTTLVDNVDFLITAVENVRRYCSTGSGKLSRSDLYSAAAGTLV